jgi:protein-glutamine gamma-glutamyltransferase
VLFGLRPLLDAGSNVRNEPEINSEDGTLVRPDVRSGSFDYRVDSSADLKGPQPGESTPGQRTLAGLRAVPATLRAQLREVAQPIVGQLPPEDRAARARALESFLRDSGEFRYTLHISAVDRKLDPVVDFLINRKEGHCEYFASALALLLRSIDIPARLVNGFKGGDWNEIGRMYCVRQKHAHSWVEAYLGEGPAGTPTWLTLDATPPSERNQSVGRVGGFLANFRPLTDLIRYVWIFYFVGYNAVRQDRFIYEPIRRLANEARKGFEIMGAALQEVASDLFRNRKIESLISVPGFFISFAVLLILVGLFKAGLWLWHPLRRWFRGPDAEATSLSAGVVFYQRLVQLLAEFGLERPPAETQAEFARRATVLLTGRGSGAEDVTDVPRLVVDAFYRVRFGQLDLSPDDLKHLETRLDALEASLRPPRA